MQPVQLNLGCQRLLTVESSSMPKVPQLRATLPLLRRRGPAQPHQPQSISRKRAQQSMLLPPLPSTPPATASPPCHPACYCPPSFPPACYCPPSLPPACYCPPSLPPGCYCPPSLPPACYYPPSLQPHLLPTVAATLHHSGPDDVPAAPPPPPLRDDSINPLPQQLPPWSNLSRAPG